MRRLAAIAAVALLGLGCESPPENQLAPGHSGAQAQRLLVFPLNVFLALPPDLARRVERVDRVLEAYLTDQGKTLERLDYRTAQRAWLEATREAARDTRPDPGAGPEAEAVSSFDAALRRLAPKLAEQHAFDALLLPAIVARPAVLTGQTVRWDGVSRRIVIPKMPEIPNSSIYWSEPYARRQEVRAPSLWSLVALPDGTKVFEGFGGLDVTFRAEWYPPRDTDNIPWMGFVPLEDPFADPDALRQGVALSLSPYLPYRPEEPDEKGETDEAVGETPGAGE